MKRMKRWSIAVLCVVLTWGMGTVAGAAPHGTYDAATQELAITDLQAGTLEAAVDAVLADENAAVGEVRSLVLGNITLDNPGDYEYIGESFTILEKIDLRDIQGVWGGELRDVFQVWDGNQGLYLPAAFSATLKEAYLPTDIVDIFEAAFRNYPALKSVNTGDLTALERIGQQGFSLDAAYNGGAMKTFTVPETCLQIMDSAFEGRRFDVLVLQLADTAIPKRDPNYDTPAEIGAVSNNSLLFGAALAFTVGSVYTGNATNDDMIRIYSYFGSANGSAIFPQDTVAVCGADFKAALQNWLDIIAAWEAKAAQAGISDLWTRIGTLIKNLNIGGLSDEQVDEAVALIESIRDIDLDKMFFVADDLDIAFSGSLALEVGKAASVLSKVTVTHDGTEVTGKAKAALCFALSDDPAVADAEHSTCHVTGVGAGSTSIAVSIAGTSKKVDVPVTVSPASNGNEGGASVTGVTLTPITLNLAVGGTSTLIPSVSPADAGNKNVTWKSSDEKVATVDRNGKVTAVGPGVCTITATTQDGGKTAACEVTVGAAVAVTGVTLNRTSWTLKTGTTATLTATISPSNATNKNATWSSNYPSRVAVDAGGRITAVSPGTAIVTVKTEDGEKTGACTVTVSDTEIVIDLSGLGLEDGVLKLKPGREVDMTIGATPEGTRFTVTGLPQGLTLTAEGRLHGTAPAEEGASYIVTVTATAPDDMERTATFTVKVVAGEVVVTPSGDDSSGCNAAWPGIALLALLLPGLRKVKKTGI